MSASSPAHLLSPPTAHQDALRRVEAYLRREQARRTLHGAAGRIERVTEWGGGQFAYHYAAGGDLIAITEADGRQRRYGYDERRRLALVDHGAGQVTRYDYDADDRLARRDDRGIVSRYTYDEAGRVTAVQHGQADRAVYRYDAAGRVRLARTAHVTTTWRYGADGRTAAIAQALGGVTLRVDLQYDAAGRLAALTLPGSEQPLRYTWDARGRPHSIAAADAVLVRFAYDDAARRTTVAHANGVTATSVAHPVDGRPLRLHVRRGPRLLLARRIEYGAAGEIRSDGERAYAYDGLGRLTRASRTRRAAGAGTWACRPARGRAGYAARSLRSPHVGVFTGPHAHVSALRAHEYAYDALDNLLAAGGSGGRVRFTHDAAGRLLHAAGEAGATTRFVYDRWGRLVQKRGPGGAWDYRYDDGGLLQEVRHDGAAVARFLYDHKGRLAWAETAGEVERYLYGDADELLAVTDGAGRPKRLLVRTPLGIHAEICGALGEGAVLHHHCDERGTLRVLTDAAGEVCARFEYDPFGQPRQAAGLAGEAAPRPCFTGRDWFPAIGLYYFGARWYDPALGRFLTPDAYTGAPDDARLVGPLHPGSRQAALRGQILGDWLKQPRVRNAWAFCANDPVGRVDPNGHWSFGGVLLMLLGAIWALPSTLLGILIEITCLVGEVIRWLVWLVSIGNVSWETPGFDAAASGHLNAFALVFSGGWLGSFSGLLGLTFGNVFFVYKEWEQSPYIAALPDPIFPPAYNGRVSIARQRMLYEHELRHTQQASWFGPFHHLALPVFGFFEWDLIINGYRDAWGERDARGTPSRNAGAAMLKPTFALTLGALNSASDSAAGGPRRIHIARDMDVPADGGEIVLTTRAGVNLLDAVNIQLGHDGEHAAVLTGTVAALRPDLLGVRVVVLGAMQKLLDLRVAAWYDNQSAGAIVRDLLDRAGQQAGTVDDGPTLPRFAVDGRQSAYAHLRRLADRLGYELYAKRDGKICFHGLGAGAGLDAGGLLGAASGAVGGAAGAIAGALLGGGGAGYQYGQHLLRGQAQRQPPAWGRVVVGGESPMSGEGDSTAHWLTANDSDYGGQAGSGAGTLLLLDPAARTKDIAARFAAGQLATVGRRAHQLTVRVLGNPQLDLGDTIDIGAAPDDLLNGSGYVRALHHYFDDERGFVTDVRVAVAAA